MPDFIRPGHPQRSQGGDPPHAHGTGTAPGGFAAERGRASGPWLPPLSLPVGVLGLSLFLSGFCGILAELSLFNLAEALLGGTNENLTYTMGFMMFAMGVGAALTGTRLFGRVTVELLVAVELSISVLAMGSVVGIYTLSGLAGGALPQAAAWLIWSFSPLLGLLIGLEIPVVLRLNDALGLQLRPNAALVLAPDYFGALVAFVLFAFWLLPTLGLARTAWLGGLLNLLVAGLVLLVFRRALRRPLVTALAFLAVLGGAATLGAVLEGAMTWAEQLHYRDGVVLSEETPYQQIVVTDRRSPGNPDYQPPAAAALGEIVAGRGHVALVRARTAQGRSGALHPSRCPRDLRLFINGGLQFSTCDEYRYHEMLVHPARFLARPPASGPFRALVLGGGDGMAVRELLKYPGGRVDLVELDEVMIDLFEGDPTFAALNDYALSDPRVTVRLGDAFAFLREARGLYNVIVLDFPDPHRTATARLYSVQLYRFAARALAPGGVLVTQSFSPLFHHAAFRVVAHTLEAAGFHVASLQVPMLTFEHWGFHLASRELTKAAMKERLEAFSTPVPTRFLNREAVQAAHRWSREGALEPAQLPVNDQFTLPLLRIYTQGQGRP